MKLRDEALVYIAVMAVMLFAVLWALFGMMAELEAQLLPAMIGSIVFLMAAAGLGMELKKREKPKTITDSETGEKQKAGGESWARYLPNLGWLIGFVVGIYLLGYLVSIPLFVLFYMRWLGSRWRIALLWAVVAVASMVVLYDVVLELGLHRGLLFELINP